MLSIISQIVPSRLQKCGFRSGFRILFGSSFPQSHNNPYAAVINKIIHSIIMPHFQFAFLFLRDTLRIRPSCSMRASGFQNFSVLNWHLILKFRTGLAYYWDKFLRGRAAGILALSYSKAETPKSRHCQARGPQFWSWKSPWADRYFEYPGCQ